jgi:hypothetical protein
MIADSTAALCAAWTLVCGIVVGWIARGAEGRRRVRELTVLYGRDVARLDAIAAERYGWGGADAKIRGLSVLSPPTRPALPGETDPPVIAYSGATSQRKSRG